MRGISVLLVVVLSIFWVHVVDSTFSVIPDHVIYDILFPFLDSSDFLILKQVDLNLHELVSQKEDEKLHNLLDSKIVRRLLFQTQSAGKKEFRKLIYLQKRWDKVLTDHQLIMGILTGKPELPILTETLLTLMIPAVHNREKTYFPDRELLSAYVVYTVQPCARFFRKYRQVVQLCIGLVGCDMNPNDLYHSYRIRHRNMLIGQHSSQLSVEYPSVDHWMWRLLLEISASNQNHRSIIRAVVTTGALAVIFCIHDTEIVPFIIGATLILQALFPNLVNPIPQ